LAGGGPAEPVVRAMLDRAVRRLPAGRRMIERIDALPAEEREAFDLVRIQGMTQTEAAEVIGVSPKTVRRRLGRGLRLLTESLRDLNPKKGMRDEG
jgi:RNA polymerase sigma-70 factor (ECF subfamily)